MDSTVGKDFGRKLDRMGSELRKAEPVAVNRSALTLTNSIRDEIKRVAPSSRLRGVGKRGAKVGARYKVRGNEAIITATGPLHLVERDTKAHTIGPKRRGGVALLLADGSLRRTVEHPGTKGQHPFAKGIAAGKPKALRELKTVTTAALRRGMNA